MIYWDSSVLLKLYVPEPDSECFLSLVSRDEQPVCSSSIATVEIRCAVSRKERSGEIKPGSVTSILRKFKADCGSGRIGLVPYGEDVLARSEQVVRLAFRPPHAVIVRSLDVLLIALALLVGAKTMIATDTRLREVSLREVSLQAGLKLVRELSRRPFHLWHRVAKACVSLRRQARKELLTLRARRLCARLFTMFLFKLIAGAIANLAIFGAPLFAIAGTWNWWRAWVLLGVVLLGTILSVTTLPRSLLEERLKPPIQEGQPRADKIVLILLLTAFAGLVVLVPLDVFHLHLAGGPGEFVSSVGLVLFAFGWWISYAALKQNAFATSVVRHQAERRQVVIDTGELYRIVRHPMYAGGVLVMIGMPLWLESNAASLFAVVPVGALIFRILVEERFLRQELEGYNEYTSKVRYRLIPFLW